MHKPKTLWVEVDGATASWSELEKPRVKPRERGNLRDSVAAPRADDELNAGGILGGDPFLVSSIHWALDPTSGVDQVLVYSPNIYWEFTEGRDTVGDVAAAMLYAGAGRAVLSDSGWDALDAVLNIDSDEEDSEEEDSEEDEDADEDEEGEFYPENAPQEETETAIF